jgi:hypothetical protein
MTVEFEQSDLAARWGCDLRTVRRHVAQFDLRPAFYRGNAPVFTLESVEAMEQRRTVEKAKASAALSRKMKRIRKATAPKNGHHVLTLAQAKRKAGRK